LTCGIVGLILCRAVARGLQITVESATANFAPTSLRVTLSVGQQANLPVLTPKGIEAAVAIIAGAEVVETSRTQQSSVISNKQITALPLSRRNYLDFSRRTPSASEHVL
jgi:redox-sensitive bicupin YhaK (pirin superfamily)